jgi:thiamine biosynthesis lipoprotein
MGTVLEITLHGEDAPEALEALFEQARQLDALMSRYDPDSDVSRLNRTAGVGPQEVDPRVNELLQKAVALSNLTRGSFDVTIGPLVALWIDAAERGIPPSAADLAVARSRVGVDHLIFYADGSVELSDPGARIDLGGIAKGYALDRMRSLLRKRGIRQALLNFGQSSIWAMGAPPDAAGWRLLVRGPGEGFLGVVRLEDQALSVSGSLGQWVEIGGRRYGHVLDPRSGRPLTRQRQALVVAQSATLAEALSKALLILGEDEGIALVASQPGCHGLLVDTEGRSWSTPGWARAVGFAALEPPQAPTRPH